MKAPKQLHRSLEDHANRRPDAPLVVHDGATTTYGELEATSNRLARALIEEGVQPGERIGLLSRNSRAFLESYYAVLKAGAIAVPLNPAAGGPSLGLMLGSCGASRLLIGNGMARHASDALRASRSLPWVGLAEPGDLPELEGAGRVVAMATASAAQSPNPPALSGGDDSPACIVFTSGSTGEPRGATLSHRGLVTSTSAIVNYLGLSASDRVLQVLPFYYVYGLSILNTHVFAGASLAIENRFMYPSVALDTLEATECTGFSGVPSNFAILLDRTDFAERAMKALRYVTISGGPASPALLRRVVSALPGREVFVMYGATEASARLSYLHPNDLEGHMGSVGKPIPGIDLRILRKDGTEALAGERGEIVARGEAIMSGYWGAPSETNAVLDSAGYHTGDLAYRDEDGYFYIVGRIRDFIKAGAHRISSWEIEQAIAESEAVSEVAVVGAPDDLLGERICAFVVARPGFAPTPADLKRDARTRLPAYKIPSDLNLVDQLPKSQSGKIQKQKLREIAANRFPQRPTVEAEFEDSTD